MRPSAFPMITMALLLGAALANGHGGLGVHSRYAATPSLPGIQPPPKVSTGITLDDQ